MWDAIDELAPDEDITTRSGDWLLVITLRDCELNQKVRERVERIAVGMPGGTDLRFAFATNLGHSYQMGLLAIAEGDLPAAVLMRHGKERDRALSVDDVLDLAEEVASRYRR